MFARVIARLVVRRRAGYRDSYRAMVPRRIPAHTSGLACTADFRDRYFTAYDLGVRLPG
jgi:hypothetical protein